MTRINTVSSYPHGGASYSHGSAYYSHGGKPYYKDNEALIFCLRLDQLCSYPELRSYNCCQDKSSTDINNWACGTFNRCGIKRASGVFWQPYFLGGLFAVNFNSYIRTHCGANRAAVAFNFFINAYRPVTLGIVFFGWHNVTFGTKMNAEQAFFANFFFNLNMSLQNQSPYLIS
jgi:hypothetical protein